MTLRLVVVDDHPIVRDGLAGIFAFEKRPWPSWPSAIPTWC